MRAIHKKIMIPALIFCGLNLCFNACKKVENIPELPELSTATITVITSTSAISGGNISTDGGSDITARGVCWNTSADPFITNFKTTDGSGIGAFSSHMTGLSPNTTYYVRAYATNSAGTSYGNLLSFTTAAFICGNTITDADGNVYNTVNIGGQCWTKENLRTTKFNDGSEIPLISDSVLWTNTTASAFCWYANEIINKESYGALYNGYAVNTGKLCPTGWHVPTQSEWESLINYAGGINEAGGKLKETGTTHWKTPNTAATDQYGFSALPGGLRGFYESDPYVSFFYLSDNGYWGSSGSGNIYSIYYNSKLIHLYSYNEKNGISIRCIKD